MVGEHEMILLNDLKFHYPGGEFDLSIQDLQIASGQQAALIGPSGSGKTTLLNLIAGILQPSSGTIQVAQTKINLLNETERREFRVSQIGLVFQEFELLSYLNGRDNILLPYRIHTGLKLNKEVMDRAESLASELEISDKLNRLPEQLSQGERQRVAIARALITRPKVMLADEPTGNLDQANKHRIVDLMLKQAEEQGVTLLMVTHDTSLLDRFEVTYDISSFLKSGPKEAATETGTVS